LIPVAAAAIEAAVALNAVAVEFNRRAFRFGRWAALDRAAVERIAAPTRISKSASPAASTRPSPAASIS
jgi:indolepyruvate ferredoxin oxidoreductase